MKILMISMFSPHFFNWTEQLKDSGHDVYWLDVYDSNTKVKEIEFVEQIIGWRYRWDYPGRYLMKKNNPNLYKFFNYFNERKLSNFFEKKIKELKPDIIQSFEFHSTCIPIYKIMKKYAGIKWIYSSWGSDLYYYKNLPNHLGNILKTLPAIDYLFTDCLRDKRLAEEMGFKGVFLGCFPGRGGFERKSINHYSKEKIIIVKGYEGLHGRSINVLKALKLIDEFLIENNWSTVVFAVSDMVKKKIEELNFKSEIQLLPKISHQKVLSLMERSMIYVGNSKSDGMPNTLLEAIVTGNFPIQSNPGGATAEIIHNGKNGYLINDPEDFNEIADRIERAICDQSMRDLAVVWNSKNIIPKLDRKLIIEKVKNCYALIESELKQ